MADINKVNQSGSTVHGDQVGRDKNEYILPKKSTLSTLSEELSNLYVNDEDYKGFIDNLNHYINRPEGEEHIGLEGKLKGTEFEDDLEEALILKEKFFKKLSQNQFSDQVQNF